MMRAEKLPVSAPEEGPVRSVPSALRSHVVVALQRTAGNVAVTALLARTPAFDPRPVVGELRQAIDQVQVKDKWTVEADDHSLHATARHVDVPAVIRVLDGLTPEQVRLVEIRYQAEAMTTLDNDLFGQGRSGRPANLTDDQAERIRALLRGTAQRPGKPPPAARLDALAAELHELAVGELAEPQRERLMALYRAHGADIEPVYEQRYGHAPAADLRGKLPARQLLRLDALRTGDVAQADAYGLDDKRAAIDALDRRHDRGGLSAVEGWYQKKRGELADDAAEIAGQSAREAMVEHPELPAAQAVQERLGPGPQSAGSADVAAALSGGHLIEAAARRLLDLEARHKTDTEHVEMLLHELHELAVHDALAALPATQRAALAHDPARREAVAAPVAKRCVDVFAVLYDSLRPAGGRSWSAILASAKHPDALEAAAAAGGKLDPVDELHFAIERKDAAAIRRVLDAHGSFAEMIELNAHYLGRYHLDLRHAVFGATGVTVALHPDSAMVPSASAVRGHDAAAVLETLDTPPANGQAEVDWIVESAEREINTVKASRGLAGAVWTPETENSMQITLALIRQLATRWHDDPSDATLAELRGARARLRVDATGYEGDLEHFRAQVRSAVGLAVQAALTLVPGVGEGVAGFIATSVVNTSANVLANLVIQGDAYDLDMLYDDVVGGLAGALGGKLGQETAGLIGGGQKASQELLELTAKQITGETAEQAIALAKAAGRSSKLVQQAGRAAKMAQAGRVVLQHGAGIAGTNLATSLATDHNQLTAEALGQGALFSVMGHALARPEAKVVTDENMKPGDAKVHYTAERPGEVEDVHVRVGKGTDPRVVAEHQAEARAVQRFQGLSGVLNTLYERAAAFVTGHPAALPGTRAFEVHRELAKLQGGVAERLEAIAGGAGDEASLAAQIKSYAQQLDHYRDELTEIEQHPERGLEPGRGWIAALSPESAIIAALVDDHGFPRENINEAGPGGAGADYLAWDDDRLWIIEDKKPTDWESARNAQMVGNTPLKQLMARLMGARKRKLSKVSVMGDQTVADYIASPPTEEDPGRAKVVLVAMRIRETDALLALELPVEGGMTGIQPNVYPVTVETVLTFLEDVARQNLPDLNIFGDVQRLRSSWEGRGGIDVRIWLMQEGNLATLERLYTACRRAAEHQAPHFAEKDHTLQRLTEEFELRLIPVLRQLPEPSDGEAPGT